MNPLVEYEATFTDGTSFSLSQTQAVERVLCDQSVQQYCGFDGKDVTDNLQYDILAIFHPHGRRQVRGFPWCDTLLLEGSGRGIHAPHRPRPQSVTKGHAMSFGETQITVIGRLTKDPELRTTGNGGMINLTIVSNVAESLSEGMKVIAQGMLISRKWTDKQGRNRERVELKLTDIGPCLSDD